MKAPTYYRKMGLARLRDSAEFLLDCALGNPLDSLTNNFVKPEFLKNRIAMLYKNKNSNWSLGKYAAVALLIGFVSLLAASCGQESKEEKQGTAQMQAPVIEAMALTQNGETDTLVVKNQLIPNYISGQELGSDVLRTDPAFPGGNEALDKFINKTMKYPATARQKDVSGNVFVMFMVNADGSIQDIQVLKGLGFGCDEEAVRIMKQTPRWLPAVNDKGEKVNMEFTMPIRFELPEEKKVGRAKSTEDKPAVAARLASFSGGEDSLIRLKPRTQSLEDAARFKPMVWLKDEDKPYKDIFKGKEYGESIRIMISGEGLLDSDNPLIVLNGVVSPLDMPNFLNTIKPEDVDFIEVIKANRARDSYGAKGANGVVRVTTKQGAKKP